MRLFDLHCDTLYKAYTEKKSIIKNDFEISLERGSDFDEWVQCMAVWIPDDVRGVSAERIVRDCCSLLENELDLYGSADKIEKMSDISKKSNVILTVEGGAALNGKLENVRYFRSLGVRAMTLTWNGSCEVGDGAHTEKPKGLTDFGKSVIPEMEQYGIVVDVSHASDKLFYDVAELAKRPFIATHSNSRTIEPNVRNLTDEQFGIIRDRGGIVGLNFHKYFLSAEKQSVTDIVRHAEHFLSLGGEDTVAIGSDFDGGELPDDLSGISDMYKIYNEFSQLNYSDILIDKLFFKNAYNFYQSFDNS